MITINGLEFIKGISAFLLLLVSLALQHFLILASKISKHKKGTIAVTMITMFITVLIVLYQIITY